METEEVVREFERWVLSRFGAMTTLVSDNGSQFVSDLLTFKSMCNQLRLRIKFVQTAPYHPEANSQVERNNSSLQAGLKALCKHRQQKLLEVGGGSALVRI